MSDQESDSPPKVGRNYSGEERPVMLVVEGDENFLSAIRKKFRKHYDVHESSDWSQGIDTVKNLAPAVVLCSQSAPNMQGVELLSQARELDSRIVRILIGEQRDDKAIVEAVNSAQIHHYFEKPLKLGDLKIVVDSLVRSAELEFQRDTLLEQLRESVRQLEESNARLRQKESELSAAVASRTEELQRRNEELQTANSMLLEMAVRDSLTGLFNHRALMEHLDLEVSRSKRYKRPFSLLFLDLDHFKNINDTHGHRAGDAVLSTFAQLLAAGPGRLRGSDFCARYGGEEFCVLLPETDLSGGQVKAERIRKSTEEFDWTQVIPAIGKPITVSIGVASFPTHGLEKDRLVQLADAALYSAKQQGRNKVIVSEDPSASEAN